MDAVKTGFSKFPGSLGAAVEEGKVPGYASGQEGQPEFIPETGEIRGSLPKSEALLIIVYKSCCLSIVLKLPCAFQAVYFDAYEKKHSCDRIVVPLASLSMSRSCRVGACSI